MMNSYCLDNVRYGENSSLEETEIKSEESERMIIRKEEIDHKQKGVIHKV